MPTPGPQTDPIPTAPAALPPAAGPGGRFGGSVQAACSSIRPPRPPALDATVTRKRARAAERRLDRLGRRLDALRPPRRSIQSFFALKTGLARLADLYGIVATGRPAPPQAIAAIHAQVNGPANELGAPACARRLPEPR